MASIRKRASKQYQARVRVQGFPESCETFLSRAAARDWMDSVERDLRRGLGPARQLAERVTVHDALARYAREVTPERKSAAHELRRIRWLQRQAFASLALTELRGSHLAQYRDFRTATGIGANTLRLELALLSHLAPRGALVLRQSSRSRSATTAAATACRSEIRR